MDASKAKELIDKIAGQVFGFQNPFNLEQFMNKFAFDLRLPQQVFDSTTNEPTWAMSTNPARFMTLNNAWARQDAGGWDIPKRPLENIQDILTAWNEVNLTATERAIDSTNVSESDCIYFSDSVYRSQDCTSSRNLVFCDSVHNSEFIAAGQRSQTSNFSIRLEDSKECSNCFNVSWSGSCTNSFFLHDCKDVHDSIFCSHMSGKRFCVANMQFEEAEYYKIKDMVVKWILTQ